MRTKRKESRYTRPARMKLPKTHLPEASKTRRLDLTPWNNRQSHPADDVCFTAPRHVAQCTLNSTYELFKSCLGARRHDKSQKKIGCRKATASSPSHKHAHLLYARKGERERDIRALGVSIYTRVWWIKNIRSIKYLTKSMHNVPRKTVSQMRCHRPHHRNNKEHFQNEYCTMHLRVEGLDMVVLLSSGFRCAVWFSSVVIER